MFLWYLGDISLLYISLYVYLYGDISLCFHYQCCIVLLGCGSNGNAPTAANIHTDRCNVNNMTSVSVDVRCFESRHSRNKFCRCFTVARSKYHQPRRSGTPNPPARCLSLDPSLQVIANWCRSIIYGSFVERVGDRGSPTVYVLYCTVARQKWSHAVVFVWMWHFWVNLTFGSGFLSKHWALSRGGLTDCVNPADRTSFCTFWETFSPLTTWNRIGGLLWSHMSADRVSGWDCSSLWPSFRGFTDAISSASLWYS